MQQAAAKNIRAFKTKSLDVYFDLDNSVYKAVQNIGTGAYGVVCAAVHKKTGEKVAIKKIPNAFEELTTAKRTYRELKIMRHFRHENVIGIREILMPREPLNDFKDVYVVLDLMESDLHHIIHSQQSVSTEHIRYFLYQILRGLKYIHSASVVHRDLKPSNLLVNENCELKIGDFGMARGLSGNADAKRKMFMTVYVATRWYRAPELLFSNEDYSYAVDMWSVGCIFAEMLGRRQIFPGKNPMHQLTLIIEVLGMPPDSLLRSTNSDQIFNFFHRNFGGNQCVTLREKYPSLDEDGLDLLSRMLMFNPEERISVTEALSHPFLAKYHDPDDEPNCYPAFDFAFEQEDLSKQQIRQNVGKMILKYQRTKLPTGKKFSGPVGVVKPFPTSSTSPASTAAPAVSIAAGAPSTSAHGSATRTPEIKAVITKSGTTGVLTRVLPPKQTEAKIIQGPCADMRSGPKEGIFKVPSLPAEEKKLQAAPEAKPAKNSEEAILSVEAVAALSVANDVDMRSAPSSAQSGAVSVTGGLAVHGDASGLARLAAPSGGANLSDVEMRSARGEQKPGLAQSTFDPPAERPPESSLDVDMKSARRQEEGAGGAGDCSAQMADEIEDPQSGAAKQQVTLECSGQKTISDDTKKLIKAVLMQSALKNKTRKDSESEKGGGKMPVTALARQRERELKRRQKLHRSMERQKKGKGKGKRSGQGQGQGRGKDEDSHQLLTDEDRSMLERWNKMQCKTIAGEGPGAPIAAVEESSDKETGAPSCGCAVADVPQSAAVAVSLPGVQQSANNSTMNEPSHVPAEPNAVSHLHRRREATGAGDGPNVGRGSDAASAVAQQQAAPAASGFDSPASATLSAFLVASRQQQQGAYTGASEARSRPGSSADSFPASATPLYGKPSPACGIYTTGTSAVYPPSTAGLSDAITRSKQPPRPDVPSSSAGTVSVSPSSGGAAAQLRSRCPPQPAAVSPSDKSLRGGSDFQQYRSRHYSDRETPSPPHHVQQSPPGYEDAMKIKTAADCTSAPDNHERYQYKPAFHYQPPNRRSPMPQGAEAAVSSLQPHPRAAPSPPELAQVIQQLSKSAMEDSLPPALQVTPKGDGSGYGLSMDLEDWLGGSFGPPSGAGKLDSGPLSASLLSDWLEVRYMNAEDMIAVQEELGLTSPFNLSDIPGLGDSPKNKDRD